MTSYIILKAMQFLGLKLDFLAITSCTTLLLKLLNSTLPKCYVVTLLYSLSLFTLLGSVRVKNAGIPLIIIAHNNHSMNSSMFAPIILILPYAIF